MSPRQFIFAGPIVLAAIVAGPAAMAQTIPMHSGHLSHGAPQMRVTGSGLHYPNRPKYHHHYGFAGYRDPDVRVPGRSDAFEANAGF